MDKGDKMHEQLEELASLRRAFRSMGLDPAKVAGIGADDTSTFWWDMVFSSMRPSIDNLRGKSESVAMYVSELWESLRLLESCDANPTPSRVYTRASVPRVPLGIGDLSELRERYSPEAAAEIRQNLVTNVAIRVPDGERAELYRREFGALSGTTAPPISKDSP